MKRTEANSLEKIYPYTTVILMLLMSFKLLMCCVIVFLNTMNIKIQCSLTGGIFHTDSSICGKNPKKVYKNKIAEPAGTLLSVSRSQPVLLALPAIK